MGEQDMHPVFLESDRIILSPLKPERDLSEYEKWVNDQDVTRFMGSGRFPATAKELADYISSYNRSKTGMLLRIFIKSSHKHIGNITLHQINWKDRHAEIGIMLGDKNEWYRGYGSEALHLIVSHAFNKINLHKVYAGVIKGNAASKRLFEKMEFREEGVLRQHFYLNGKYRDMYRLGLLKKEYNRITK